MRLNAKINRRQCEALMSALKRPVESAFLSLDGYRSSEITSKNITPRSTYATRLFSHQHGLVCQPNALPVVDLEPTGEDRIAIRQWCFQIRCSLRHWIFAPHKYGVLQPNGIEIQRDGTFNHPLRHLVARFFLDRKGVVRMQVTRRRLRERRMQLPVQLKGHVLVSCALTISVYLLAVSRRVDQTRRINLGPGAEPQP